MTWYLIAREAACVLAIFEVQKVSIALQRDHSVIAYQVCVTIKCMYNQDTMEQMRFISMLILNEKVQTCIFIRKQSFVFDNYVYEIPLYIIDTLQHLVFVYIPEMVIKNYT